MRLNTIYLLPLFVTTLVVIFFWRESENNARLQSSALATVGKPLPSFNLPTLYNPTLRFTNQSLQGHVAILNIWASWCNACTNEHATLLAIKNQYNFPIYGLDYKDNLQDAENWLQKNGNPFAIIGIDSGGETGEALHIYGTPETFLIDKHGMIRYVYLGALNIEAWKNTLWPLIVQYQAES